MDGPVTEKKFDELAKKLKGENHTKEFLIKNLKVLSETLASCGHGASVPDDVKNLLVEPYLIHHVNKEVQLNSAVCIGYVFKTSAPECPYENDVLKEVFPMLVDSLKCLGDIMTENRSKRAFELLQTLAKYKIFLLMLDLELEDTVAELFRTLLSCAINDKNVYSVGSEVLEVLGSIIEEYDHPHYGAGERGEGEEDDTLELATQVLDEILRPLMPPYKDSNVAAYETTKSLLRRCEVKLLPYIQRFLMEVIDKGHAEESVLEGDRRDFIFELYMAWPECMLSVLPRVIDELQSNDETTRVKAVDLLGRLLLIPGSTVAREYKALFQEFMRRFKDIQVSVRLGMLSWAETYLLALGTQEGQPGPAPTAAASGSGGAGVGIETEVCNAVHTMVLDLDERVRTLACNVICNVAAQAPSLIPTAYLKSVAVRLRDKKAAVRRQVLSRLAMVYSAHLSQSSAKHELSHELDWIPGKILQCCEITDCRQHVVEPVLVEELFSSKLSPEEVVWRWMWIWLELEEREMKSLVYLLRAKEKFQVALKAYLAQRHDLKSSTPGKAKKGVKESAKAAQEAKDAREQACLMTAKGLADHFPDPAKAKDALEKMHSLKDGHIFRGLEQLLEAKGDSGAGGAETLRQDVMARVQGSMGGEKGKVAEALVDLMHLLLVKASPPVINQEQAAAGLMVIQRLCGDAVAEEGRSGSGVSGKGKKSGGDTGGGPGVVEEEEEGLSKAEVKKVVVGGLKLLGTVGGFFPLLFLQSLPHLQALLQDGHSEAVVSGVLRILSAVMPGLTPHLTKQQCAELAPLLSKICSEGTRDQAKHAVRVLIALAKSEILDESNGKGVKSPTKSTKTGSTPRKNTPRKGSPPSEVLEHLYVSKVDELLKEKGKGDQACALLVTLGEIAQRHHKVFELRSQELWNCLKEMLSKPGTLKGGPAKALTQVQIIKAMVKCCLTDDKSEESKQQSGTRAKQLIPMLSSHSKVWDSQVEASAGGALLRLAWQHDSLMVPKVVRHLGSLMQHQDPTVRSSLLRKLAKAFNKKQLGLKYAALLPLCAVDPVKEYHQNAMTTLQAVVRDFRGRAHSAQRKLAGQGVSKSQVDVKTDKAKSQVMLLMPEYIFTYLISILAHHPKFPTIHDDSTKTEAYTPFEEILKFLLQALATATEGSSGESPVALPFICKFLRYIKSAEDATDSASSHSLYVLSDMALLLLSEVSAAKGWSIGSFPSAILLPAQYFKARDPAALVTSPGGTGLTSAAISSPQGLSAPSQRRSGDGSHLPVNFRLTLKSLVGSNARGRTAAPTATASEHPASNSKVQPGVAKQEIDTPGKLQSPEKTPGSLKAEMTSPTLPASLSGRKTVQTRRTGEQVIGGENENHEPVLDAGPEDDFEMAPAEAEECELVKPQSGRSKSTKAGPKGSARRTKDETPDPKQGGSEKKGNLRKASKLEASPPASKSKNMPKGTVKTKTPEVDGINKASTPVEKGSSLKRQASEVDAFDFENENDPPSPVLSPRNPKQMKTTSGKKGEKKQTRVTERGALKPSTSPPENAQPDMKSGKKAGAKKTAESSRQSTVSSSGDQGMKSKKRKAESTEQPSQSTPSESQSSKKRAKAESAVPSPKAASSPKTSMKLTPKAAKKVAASILKSNSKPKSPAPAKKTPERPGTSHSKSSESPAGRKTRTASASHIPSKSTTPIRGRGNTKVLEDEPPTHRTKRRR